MNSEDTFQTAGIFSRTPRPETHDGLVALIRLTFNLTVLFVVVLAIFYAALGYYSDGFIGMAGLIAYAAILLIVSFVSFIPIAGIPLFYYISAQLPHSLISMQFSHIVFDIQLVFVWLIGIIMSAIAIFLLMLLFLSYR